MPEMGLEEEPISPVSREDTVTNRKPNTTISTAPSRFMCSEGAARMARISARMPAADEFHGQVPLGAEDRGVGDGGSLEIGQPGPDAVQDDGQRPQQADDAARRDRARADIEDVGAADVARAHVGNGLGARRQRRRSGPRRRT